jgi:rare lipoprotein A
MFKPIVIARPVFLTGILAVALAGLSLAGTAPANAQNLAHASYYGKELAGRKTASGERFNPSGMTAAHRSLPFGTRLKLTNPRNGRTVVVRINDRGPFVRGRTLDVSHGAANALGFAAQGTANLRVERYAGLSAEKPLMAEKAMRPEQTAKAEASTTEEPTLAAQPVSADTPMNAENPLSPTP